MKRWISVFLVFALTITGVASFLGTFPEPAESATSSEAVWPSYGYDPSNTRRTSNEVYYTGGGARWTFDIENNMTSNMVIGLEGTMYVASLDCKVFALDPDGKVKWTYSVPDERDFSKGYYQLAVSDDGTLYISGGKLYALNPDSSIKWKVSIDGRGDMIQLADDGTIYLRNSQHKLYSINPNGTVRWSNKFDFSSGLPAIGEDGTIYMGSSARKFYAIDPNGTLKWNFTAAYDYPSTPTIGDDGTIYFTSGNLGFEHTNLYALNKDGTEKWNLTLNEDNSSASNPPALGRDGTIYISTDIFNPEECSLTAITPEGEVKWEETHGSYILYPPVVDGKDNIFVASVKLIDENNLTLEGSIYAHGQDGTERWNFTPPGNRTTGSIAVGSDGTLYVGCQKGKIYALGGGLETPSGPRDLEVEGSAGQVNLSWDEPANGGTSEITEFKIYRGESANSMSELTTTEETTYVDSGVSSNTTYYYKVSAVNSAGEGEKSEQVSVTVPAEEKDGNGEKDTPAPGMAIFVFILSLVILVYDHHQKN